MRIEKDKYALTVVYRTGSEPEENDPFLCVRRFFQTHTELCKEMQDNQSAPRWRFETTLATMRYYHDCMLRELERLDGIGLSVDLAGKDVRHIKQDLEELQRQAFGWDQQNACENMFRNLHYSLDYHAPRLFVVLPSDIDSWIDSDPSTHTFRLHFLCDFENLKNTLERLCPHDHFMDHPGYELQRPQEFFQIFGEYIQRILMMVKHGFSNGDHHIPPLETGQILWNCQSGTAENCLSRQNIGVLVDKALDYFHKMLPLTWISKVNLEASETRAIKDYLSVPHDDNGQGGLYRYFRDNSFIYWECQSHALRNANHESLSTLKELIEGYGGRFDLQQASLHLELCSVQQAIGFRKHFKRIRHKFDVSFKLVLETSRQFLEEFLQGIAKDNAATLEVDGVTLAIHPQDHIEFGYDMFSRLLHNSELQMVTVLDYPRPQDRALYIGVIPGYVCALRFRFSGHPMGIQWQRLKVDLTEFLETFLGVGHDGSGTERDPTAVPIELRAHMDRHGLIDVTEVSFHAHQLWFGRFDCDSGEVLQLQLHNTDFPKTLTSGSLRKLTVDFMDRDFTEQPLESILLSNKWLQELDLLICEHEIFRQIERFITLWARRSTPFLLTLFERTTDHRGRVLAQVAFGGLENEPSATQDLLPTIVFRQWDCDHFSGKMSDSTAALLDLATRHHPSVLKFFTFAISELTPSGLGSLQNILRRSSLERLRIHCSDVPPHFSRNICNALHSIQWVSLRSLVLYGDQVGEWIELWAVNVKNTRTVLPQLLSLEIAGSGTSPQQISHEGALLLHQWIHSSPLVEMGLENVCLHDGRDVGFIHDVYTGLDSDQEKTGIN